MAGLGRGFDLVADLYDDIRPHYPDELYDAIDAVCRLGGADVLDLAAGTGIATRALLSRGARVTALDPGEPMVRRLRSVSPAAAGVVGRAEQLPLRDNGFDLVTCATAWHWLDPAPTLEELRRVSRPGGQVALWWANHRWGDGIDWEDAQSAVHERWETERGSRPPSEAYNGVLPREAAADLRARGLDVVVDTEFTWIRQLSREDHIRAVATHSDVIALGDQKQQFLDDIAAALDPWPVVTERLWGPLVVARL
ncbi:MAG TPA: class I SAM-dependent methyltransferase [Mycobacteriales bacterium]|jgi:SAM-dependent methyltransferase|nr:class I SAM-dependent methyltransferase [Mycobacteriales bacterium]